MEIELVKDVKINICMQSYIKEEIKTFGEDVSRGVTSPETSGLYYVTRGVEIFLEEKYTTFHSTVAKLLWIMNRSRPDIETDIYFSALE